MTKAPTPRKKKPRTHPQPAGSIDPLDGSAESLRLLVDHVPGVIYLCRNDDCFSMVYLNDAVETLVGYPAKDFLSGHVNFVDLYHPEDAPQIFDDVSRALGGDNRFHLIYRLKHRDGDWRWIEEFGLGIERDGRVDFLEGYLRDITDRVEAQNALRHSEELNRRIIETVPAGIVEVDMGGSILVANAHAQDILGLTYDEITKKYIYDFDTETVREDRSPCPYTEYPVYLCLKTLEPQGPVTMGVKRPDGEISWGIYSAVPVFDEKNRDPRGAVVTFLDITWRKEAEEALKSSETRWRTLVENAPSNVAIIDPEGNHLYTNRVAPGFDLSEVLDSKVYKWVPEDQHQVIRDSIEETLRTGGPVKYEIEVNVPGSGSTWWTCCMGLIDPSAEETRIMVVSTDMTSERKAKEDLAHAHTELEERVRLRTAQLTETNGRLQEEILEREKAQEELRKAKELAESANRAKGDFIASMSHELRTPLTSILGFVGLLAGERHGSLTDSQDEFVTTIRRNAEHLLSLINDILDVAKSEAGKTELVRSVVNLDVLIRQCTDMISSRALESGLVIETDPTKLGDAVVDERKVRQIILNLLANACKFTPVGGRIGVSGRRTSEEVEITVWDTGIGIANTEKESIFERFRQIDSGDSRKYPGTGLGLTLAKKFVEIHGGRIWVESQEKKGSRFTFTIPLTTEPEGDSSFLTSGSSHS